MSGVRYVFAVLRDALRPAVWTFALIGVAAVLLAPEEPGRGPRLPDGWPTAAVDYGVLHFDGGAGWLHPATVTVTRAVSSPPAPAERLSTFGSSWLGLKIEKRILPATVRSRTDVRIVVGLLPLLLAAYLLRWAARRVRGRDRDRPRWAFLTTRLLRPWVLASAAVGLALAVTVLPWGDPQSVWVMASGFEGDELRGHRGVQLMFFAGEPEPGGDRGESAGWSAGFWPGVRYGMWDARSEPVQMAVPVGYLVLRLPALVAIGLIGNAVTLLAAGVRNRRKSAAGGA